MRVFDPAKISIMFAGRLLQGWADGDFVSISNTTDAFVSVAGTDGEVTRVKTNDRRATVTVTTMQSSPVNDMLSAIHTLDILTPNGQGVGPLNIADCNGTSLYAAEQAWIVKSPDATFG